MTNQKFLIPKSIYQVLWLAFALLAQQPLAKAQRANNGSIIGTVVDEASKALLQGATVDVEGNGEHIKTLTDAEGRFVFPKVAFGQYVLHISYLGYMTVDLPLDVNKDVQQITVPLAIKNNNTLEEVVVSTQKRNEKLLTVPVAISAVSKKTITDLAITDLTTLSNFTPGLNIAVQSAQHPLFTIRGISSDDYGAFSRSRLSIYHNGVPISRGGGGSIEIFDMDVQAIKGPQGTIFGQGSLIGGLNYQSSMPVNFVETNASVGIGNYGQNIISALVNTPLIDDKLLLRVGAIYNNRDGYVENTFGGMLNGQNAFAGKAYLTYNASPKTQINFMYDFEDNNSSGTSFFTGLPNAYGNADNFSGVISLVPGKNLGVERTINEISVNVNHKFNNELSLTYLPSYRAYTANEYWNSDGAAAKALNFIEYNTSKQFYQELRLNYDTKKIKAFAGASYYIDDMDARRFTNPDQRNLFWIYTRQLDQFILPNGMPNSQEIIPAGVPGVAEGLVELPLLDGREENMYTYTRNSSIDYFADLTYKITDKLSVTGGIRLTKDYLNSGYRADNNGVPSTVGYLIAENQDYIIFRPSDQLNAQSDTIGVTGRAVVQYQFDANSNLYASYSTGRRPGVLQYSNAGAFSRLNPEFVRSYETGFKQRPIPNLYYDIAVFYYNYTNFLTRSQAFGEQFAGVDNGRATSYGTEVSVRYSANENLGFTVNYGYNHTRYDENNAYGDIQELRGQQFKLAPDHIVTLLADFKKEVSKNVSLFINPSFNYKSSFPLFDNAMDINPELYQGGYGIVNAIAGARFKNPEIIASFYCNNILDREYYLNGANTGRAYGLPGYVPGAPRMYGVRLSYSLVKK